MRRLIGSILSVLALASPAMAMRYLSPREIARNEHRAMEAARHAERVYGVPVSGMMALGGCESGYRYEEGVQNTTPIGGSNASGWTQILWRPDASRSNPKDSTWDTTPYAKYGPFNYRISALATGFIWDRADGKLGNRRGDFHEWADYCATKGDYAS